MCDSVVVVRDDLVLFGKNSDRDPNEAQRLSWHARHEHPPGALLRCTWTAIPQARVTHRMLLSRPYWMWGAEMGANEHGVVIGNEAVFTRAPTTERGLTGMDLVRLGLERSESAAEAAEVIATLLREHGQGGRSGYDDPGFRYDSSFLIADPSGALVLETSGRESVRAAVGRGARAISNGLTLPGFAARHGDRLRSTAAQCRRRRARVEALATSARAPQDIATVLRDHGGAASPRYHPLNGAMSAPCMHAGGLIANGQTVASWISALTPERPRHYATATAAPCLSAFKPIALDTPLDLGAPTGVYDDESVWWRFETLHRRLIGDEEACRAHRYRRARWETATWDGSLAPSSAFDAWRRFVAEATPHDGTDARPTWTRRYWAARERDARATTPKLPAWPPR